MRRFWSTRSGRTWTATIFSIYGNQDAAVLALTNGDIDYLFNPLGLEKGFQDRIRSADDLQIVSNADNGVFYLGFNVRKAPMSSKEFRQVVATLIDKEFVAQTILQDAVIPMYAMVPEGNAAWHNPDVSQVSAKVRPEENGSRRPWHCLKSAGFTYEQEPEVGEDGGFVAKPGKGLEAARRHGRAGAGAAGAECGLRSVARDIRHLGGALAERHRNPGAG